MTSLHAALTNPSVNRLDISHHRWLGEALATELTHGGKDDIPVEVIQILLGVPELHHLPPTVDRTSSERQTLLRREQITNRRHDPSPAPSPTPAQQRRQW